MSLAGEWGVRVQKTNRKRRTRGRWILGFVGLWVSAGASALTIEWTDTTYAETTSPGLTVQARATALGFDPVLGCGVVGQPSLNGAGIPNVPAIDQEGLRCRASGHPICGLGPVENPNDIDCGIASFQFPDNLLDPEKNLGTCEQSCATQGATTKKGNPISTGTGNKVQVETDYRGAGAFPLEFRRVYNSETGVWDHSYSQSISGNGVGSTSTLADVIRDDAAEYEFAYLTVGTWRTWNDVDYQLSAGTGNGWELVTPSDVVEVYDADGRLQSITNRAGQSVTFAYDGSNRLQTATHYTGRTLTLTYDGSGRLATMTDPAGNITTYSYDGSGRLEEVARPDATPGSSADNPVRVYHYEDANYPNALTGITDENGDRYATWSYNTSGQAVSSEHGVGIDQTSISYFSNKPTITNALGISEQLTLSTLQGTPRVTRIDTFSTPSVAATVETFTYDSNGYRDVVTDAEGNITDYDYNDRGLLESKIEAVGTADERTTTMTWHASFRVPTQIVRPGQTIDMTYDSAGRMLTRTVTDTQSQSVPYTTTGNTRTTTYTYNAFGLVATIDGPRTGVSDITTFAYDTNGDLLSTTNALGQVTEITARDARGLPTQIEDANDTVTVLAYNERGWLTSSTVQSSQGNAVTTYTYDDVGQVETITLPDSSSLTYEYDAAHRMTAVENNLGERIEYTLDNAGNRTAEVIKDTGSTVRKTMTRVFDELSRLREVVGAASQSTTFAYDLNDNLTSTTDDNSNASSSAYDALDRLITATDPATNDTDYAYDDRDNLTSVTDANGVVTAYTYDGLDSLIQKASDDAGTTVNVYDAAGNLTQRTDPRGRVSNRTYDALGRLLTVSYPASPLEDIAYTYDLGTDGVGRLSAITDVSGSTSYTYDDRGNVLSETRVFGGQTYVTSYGYDLADNLLTTTYPSGRVVTVTRDALSRPSSLTTQAPGGSVETVASNMTYLPFGGLSTWTYGNGLTGSHTYDADYRLTGIDTDVYDRTLSYDGVNNITAIADNLNGSRSQTFDYDVLDRLTDATGAYGDIDYTYDPVGNRLSRDIVDGTDTLSETYAYQPSSNRLSSVARNDNGTNTTRLLDYTAGGNTDYDQQHDGSIRTLDYNDRNRLTSVDDGSGNLGTYTYNALGQRVIKVEDGATTHYHYDTAGQLLAETDDQGVVIREYVYADGMRLGMIVAGSGGVGSGGEIVLDTTSPQFSSESQWHAINGSTYLRQRAQNTPTGGVMLDEQDAVLVGSWSTKSRTKSIEGDYLLANTGAGNRTATWTLTLPESVDYDVWVTYRKANSYSTAAPITVADAATTQTVTINQTTNVGHDRWVNIATHSSLTGQLVVTASNATDGKVSVDAIYVVPSANSGRHTATWDLQVPATDTYDVYAKWPAGVASPSTKAKYVVNHDGGSTQVNVSQSSSGDVWNSLGSFTMSAGTGLIELSARVYQTTRILYADEVRLVPQNPGSGGSELHYVHSDHLGTPQVISDGSQAVAWDADYRPFGEVDELVSAVEQPLRFPGQIEGATGLSYNYFRDYDFTLGSYVQSDPSGLEGGLNRFAYVSGNPFGFADTFGLYRRNSCEANPLTCSQALRQQAINNGSKRASGAKVPVLAPVGGPFQTPESEDVQCKRGRQPHRGRIQVQGRRHGRAVDVSQNWFYHRALTKADGIVVLNLVVAKVKPRDLPRFSKAISRAERHIYRTATMRAGEPGSAKASFYNWPQFGGRVGEERVDIEVFAGEAF